MKPPLSSPGLEKSSSVNQVTNCLDTLNERVLHFTCFTNLTLRCGKQMTLKKIGILYHPLIETAAAVAGEIKNFLESKKVTAWLSSSWEVDKARAFLPATDLILSVGGDGNILRSVYIANGSDIPITGINLGRLGFMTELSAYEAKDKLLSLIAGEGWLDERAMLQAALSVGNTEKIFHALNDVVLARGAVARVVNIEAAIDGVRFTNYFADGVIAATATGSTGYSLSAGGPILNPRAREFLLVPMLPHLCHPYPLVLPGKSEVKLKITTPYAATLAIDGHTNLSIDNGSTVIIKESKLTARFLRIHPENSFYSTLEQRLKGRKDASPGPESQNR